LLDSLSALISLFEKLQKRALKSSSFLRKQESSFIYFRFPTFPVSSTELDFRSPIDTFEDKFHGNDNLNAKTSRCSRTLIQIQTHLTLITSNRAPENFIPALRTNIAGFFILNPFFRTHLSPIRYSPQDNLFAYSHGKIFNILAREFIALVTSSVTFLSCAFPDLALPAVHELFVR